MQAAVTGWSLQAGAIASWCGGQRRKHSDRGWVQAAAAAAGKHGGSGWLRRRSPRWGGSGARGRRGDELVHRNGEAGTGRKAGPQGRKKRRRRVGPSWPYRRAPAPSKKAKSKWLALYCS